MTMYLVKSVSIATEKNKNYVGQRVLEISGKANQILYYNGNPWYSINLMTAPFIRERGYSRKCDAARSYEYRFPENSDYWKTTAEIIAIEI